MAFNRKPNQSFLDNFRRHEANYLHRGCVYLIFGGYNGESIIETRIMENQGWGQSTLYFSTFVIKYIFESTKMYLSTFLNSRYMYLN